MTHVLALVADLGAAPRVAARVGRLSPASEARLARIRAPHRRAQSTFARQLAALAASRLLGRELPGESVDESEDDAGLRLRGAPGLCVSIAHSRERVAVAVGDGPVGIDVECCDGGRDCLGLARYACSAAEVAWLERAAPEQRPARFYLLWTLREAAFKAGLRPTARGGESCLDPDSAGARFCWGSHELGGYRVSVAMATAARIEWLGLADGDLVPLAGRRAERLGHAGATVTT
jgi:4'-phosphopantetheinyl transferase